MQNYFDQTRWNMEDINIFENGRRPHCFINGRQPQVCSRQPRELIFGMQHRLNPTMEDNLNFFWKWKTTSIFFKIKDDLNLFWKSKTNSIFDNGRLPQFFENGKQTKFFENERQPHFLKMEDDLIFLKLEDDLNFFLCKMQF